MQRHVESGVFAIKLNGWIARWQGISLASGMGAHRRVDTI